MREDSGDSPSLAPRQFSAPCFGIEMLEYDLIHSLVDGITLHQYLAKVEANVRPRVGHGTTSSAATLIGRILMIDRTAVAGFGAGPTRRGANNAKRKGRMECPISTPYALIS